MISSLPGIPLHLFSPLVFEYLTYRNLEIMLRSTSFLSTSAYLLLLVSASSGGTQQPLNHQSGSLPSLPNTFYASSPVLSLFSPRPPHLLSLLTPPPSLPPLLTPYNIHIPSTTPQHQHLSHSTQKKSRLGTTHDGIPTFAHLPWVNCVNKTDVQAAGGFDIGIVGAPFDLGVSYRPGARFGPEGARAGGRRLSGPAGWS